MPILFSAVAKSKLVVAKFACCDGNFNEIVEQVLLKIENRNHKMTYSHGHYLLHCVVDHGHLFFCITDKTCQRSRAFLFLNEIQRRFDETNNSYNEILSEEMHRYSQDYNTIIIRNGELDELNCIGVGNSESILGEKILYVKNPEKLTFSTVSYVGSPAQRVLTYGTAESDVSRRYKAEKVSFRFCIVIITVVIFVLIWLDMPTVRLTAFVVLVLLIVVYVVRFRNKNKIE